MSNKTVEKQLAKTIREEDGFIIRAAKCMGIHMECSDSFESEVGFKMRSVTKDRGGEYDSPALLVKTDAFEYLETLFAAFIDNADPLDETTEEDLRHVCAVYERERQKGVELGYIEITFFLNGDSSEIRIKTSSQLEMTVGNLTWNGPLFLTK